LNISFNRITFGKISIDIVAADESVDSFKLYSKYSESIHEKKEKSMSSYVNFLCLQALSFQKEESSAQN
jgi:arginyl-tRNA--protein-N-Asp/Glu arginylyltransferase